jgi:PAT family beta-lactamase induction signal transducer AmpG
LDISLEQFSIINGTVGVVMMLTGGIIGGLFASRYGLRRSLWIMALAITLPDAAYLWLSAHPTDNLLLIGTAVAVEQFGYGFGFTAYMLYLMYFSKGERQTSHYALCTAFMAIGMMLPGMVAGFVQEKTGYTTFFGIVMIFCLVTLVVTQMIRGNIDENYGKSDK